VDVRGTHGLYRRDAEWPQFISTYIAGETLDVGSKYGLVTKAEDIVALDIAKDHLRFNVHKDRALADACNLQFINASFEIAVTTEILEHLEYPNRAVSEIRRVLRSKGRAIVSVPNRYSAFSEPTHIHNLEEKVRLLYRGFKVDVCRAITSRHIFGVFEAIG
jgi:SAM-dependent methyltransferase